MTTTQTMPLPPNPPAPPNNGKPLNIILAVLGGLVILTLVIATARSAFASVSREHSVHEAEVSGVTALEVSASSGRFDLVFADTDKATLEVKSAKSASWKLHRERDRLVVEAPNAWDNFCFFGCGFDDNEATLVLPQSMDNGRLDADFELSAGSFNAVGAYKDLVVEVGAGELNLTGSAHTADIDLGAGEATVRLDNVRSARFDISAGELIGELSGTAPKSIEGSVSAGSLELELPEATYDLRQNTAAGSVENLLATDPNSPNKITIDVSAGSATLHPAGTAQESVGR
ncbi:hypothetical protein ACFQ4U_15550 [Micrococcus antarcticus]